MGATDLSPADHDETGAELDFFVSYARADERWAEWIAWELEAEDYRVAIQKWDFGPGSNFLQRMQEAVSRAERTVLVLSPAYLESEYAAAEWFAAFRLDPIGKRKRLLPIRVKPCEPEGLLGPIVYVDFACRDFANDEGEAQARRLLLDAARGNRPKPASNPTFPGRDASSATTRPAHFPGKLPTIFAVPHRRNPFFAGREVELEQLRAMLGGSSGRVHAIQGLGGIGKTGVAVEYAYRESSNYDVVLWAVVDSPENLTSSLAALVTALQLPKLGEVSDDIRVGALRTYLERHARWLLVLDNADSEPAQRAVLEFLPKVPLGHVLITSRRSDWPVLVVEPLRIDVLSIDQAVDFLIKRTGHLQPPPGTRAEAGHVARELGGLPLALEQAAAYVEKKRVTFVKYVGDLAQTRATVFEHPVPGATDYKHTVGSTWLLSERELGVAARAILALVGFYASDEIPRELFAQGMATFGRVVARGGVPLAEANIADAADRALIELADYSLVNLNPQTFTCHPLLLAVLRDRLTGDERQYWGGSALAVLLEATRTTASSDDARAWHVWDPLHMHIAAAVAHSERARDVEIAVPLMNGLGAYLVAKARFPEAKPFLERALHMTESALGREDPRVLTCLNNLATLLLRTNQVKEAESLLRRALKIAQEKLGSDDPSVATYLGNLAGVLVETSRHTEAEPLLRDAARIDEEVLGPQDPRLAVRLNALGRLLEDTNRRAEAAQHFQRALDIAEASLDAQHPLVATVLNNYARLLEAANKPAEAEKLFRRALKITEALLGPKHPDVAIRLNNLAHLYHHSGRLAEAEPLLQRALDVTESALGPHHRTVATRLHNIACLFVDTNRIAEAETLSRRALVILLRFRRDTGYHHPSLQKAASNHARILRALGFSEGRLVKELATIRMEVDSS